MKSMIKMDLVNKEGNVEIVGETGDAIENLAIGVALAVEMIVASQTEFSRETILTGLFNSIEDAIYTSSVEVEFESENVERES